MKEFNTSLLRERFVIQAPDTLDQPFVAQSNRMKLELKDRAGEIIETFIVRAQNMHSCIRMSAYILKNFKERGPILKRPTAFEWDDAWDMTVNNYEYSFNPHRWVAVYHKGKVIYSSENHHPFLDVIEKCDTQNEGPYDGSISIAEAAFKKTGKNIKIDHEGNVALVVNLEHDHGRCGIILRGPRKTTIFNFTITPKNGNILNFFQCMTTSAAFLEGIQLAFLVGISEEKSRLGIAADDTAKEIKRTREARRRLPRLEKEINILENSFEISYRPEKPNFQTIMYDAGSLL